MRTGAAPLLSEVIARAIVSVNSDSFFALPGRIESYDPTKRTADVTPMVRRPVPSSDDSTPVLETLPVLPGVAVAWPRPMGGIIHWPLSAGDFGDLLVQTWDISQWLVTGGVSDPQDFGQSHISSAIFVPWVPYPNVQAVLPVVPNDGLVIDAPKIYLCKDATLHVALAELVASELTAIAAQFGHGLIAPAGGGPITGASYSPGNVAATKVLAK